MRIVITGGTGFLGTKLVRALLGRGEIAFRNQAPQPIRELVLFSSLDAADLPCDPRLTAITGDVTDAAAVGRVLSPGADGVYHLAAVVSANAEADFDFGMHVNLEGTRNVLEACRRLPQTPRVVFASSIAVYGGEMPPVLDDSTILTPQNSYGTQKAIGELLLNDYSRRGFLDGRALRLPTVVVRPGAPNKAASSFASSILREPLAGQPAICPVSPQTAMYVLSPRRAVEALLRGLELPAEAFGTTRMLTLPGLTVTVAEMVDALRDVAGAHVAGRIEWRRDPEIEQIVGGWASRFDVRRARALGFEADSDFADIIRAHIEDELGGTVR
jgi:nucleoside-diphosphate-sugar epimerase